MFFSSTEDADLCLAYVRFTAVCDIKDDKPPRKLTELMERIVKGGST